ncbi:ATP-binding Cassette (ABC) Superfamily [Phytophthora nicotianae]|uniref:ATP-binding Cassette (ABC) Superfamily n=1 Tax=Phytophthora nicotianae TaxID=4792 RepID=A0A0W8BYH7_PHYNI|nr:ATP-binding Cassette (ABC) Superfamily [Phytophthora nicotianae]
MSDTSSPKSSLTGSKDFSSGRSAQASSSSVGVDSSDRDQEEVRVTAPRFEQWYDTWDSFRASLVEYQMRTSQLYRIRTTVKATTRNQISRRRKSTSCEVILCATVMRFPEMHTFRICVTKHKRNHNHKLSKKIFKNYPSSRKVTDPDVLDLVEELIKVGDKPKKILKYLQETTGKRIILRDVHNLVQRIKAKCRGSGTVEDRLEAVLRKFCSNRGNTATVLIDDAKRTQTITIQT